MSEILIDELRANCTLRAENPNQGEALFTLPSSIKFFEGHFPDNPILPAFAIIEISLALGRKLNLLQGIKKVSNAKFLSALKPQDQIKVLITKDSVGVDFEWQQLQGNNWKKASEISVES